MSIKINLGFETRFDIDFRAKGISFRLIRLISRIKLKSKEGFTRTYDAIVDTGNPITIIHFSIWSKASVHLISHDQVKLYGLGTEDNSAIKGNIGKVEIIFLDEQGSSDLITLKAYLIEDDKAPLLIGFEDVLTLMKLVPRLKSSVSQNGKMKSRKSIDG